MCPWTKPFRVRPILGTSSLNDAGNILYWRTSNPLRCASLVDIALAPPHPPPPVLYSKRDRATSDLSISSLSMFPIPTPSIFVEKIFQKFFQKSFQGDLKTRWKMKDERIASRSVKWLANGCYLLAAGCYLLAAGSSLLVNDCFLLAAGSSLLVTGCYLLAAGC